MCGKDLSERPADSLPITECNVEAAALASTRTVSFFDRYLR